MQILFLEALLMFRLQGLDYIFYGLLVGIIFSYFILQIVVEWVFVSWLVNVEKKEFIIILNIILKYFLLMEKLVCECKNGRRAIMEFFQQFLHYAHIINS